MFASPLKDNNIRLFCLGPYRCLCLFARWPIWSFVFVFLHGRCTERVLRLAVAVNFLQRIAPSFPVNLTLSRLHLLALSSLYIYPSLLPLLIRIFIFSRVVQTSLIDYHFLYILSPLISHLPIMSGSGGFYKYRCKYFLTHDCPNWVFVNYAPCADCCVS